MNGEMFLLRNSEDDSHKLCYKHRLTGQVLTLNKSPFDSSGDFVSVTLNDGTTKAISKDESLGDTNFDDLTILASSHYNYNTFPKSLSYSFDNYSSGSRPHYTFSGYLRGAYDAMEWIYYNPGRIHFMRGLSLNDKAAIKEGNYEQLFRSRTLLQYKSPLTFAKEYQYGESAGDINRLGADQAYFNALLSGRSIEFFSPETSHDIELTADHIDCFGNQGKTAINTIQLTSTWSYNESLTYSAEVVNKPDETLTFTISKNSFPLKFIIDPSLPSTTPIAYELRFESFIFSLNGNDTVYFSNENVLHFPEWNLSVKPHINLAKPIRTRLAVRIFNPGRPSRYAFFSIPITIDKSFLTSIIN
jgi:hypothetical protein